MTCNPLSVRLVQIQEEIQRKYVLLLAPARMGACARSRRSNVSEEEKMAVMAFTFLRRPVRTASWAASPSTIGGGRRRRRPAAVVLFLDECDSLVSSSGDVAATLAAILDGMEGGGGAAGWDRSSGERYSF